MEVQTSSPSKDWCSSCSRCSWFLVTMVTMVTMVSPVQGRTWPPCTSRASDVRCHGRGRLCPDPDSIVGLQSSPDETVEHAVAMLTSPVPLFLCLFCKRRSITCHIAWDIVCHVTCSNLDYLAGVYASCEFLQICVQLLLRLVPVTWPIYSCRPSLNHTHHVWTHESSLNCQVFPNRYQYCVQTRHGSLRESIVCMPRSGGSSLQIFALFPLSVTSPAFCRLLLVSSCPLQLAESHFPIYKLLSSPIANTFAALLLQSFDKWRISD